MGGVFTTLASHNGWKNGVIVELEECISEKVLHVCCKHHLFKHICSNVIAIAQGDTKLPECSGYQELTSVWSFVNTPTNIPFKLA